MGLLKKSVAKNKSAKADTTVQTDIKAKPEEVNSEDFFDTVYIFDEFTEENRKSEEAYLSWMQMSTPQYSEWLAAQPKFPN